MFALAGLVSRPSTLYQQIMSALSTPLSILLWLRPDTWYVYEQTTRHVAAQQSHSIHIPPSSAQARPRPFSLEKCRQQCCVLLQFQARKRVPGLLAEKNLCSAALLPKGFKRASASPAF